VTRRGYSPGHQVFDFLRFFYSGSTVSFKPTMNMSSRRHKNDDLHFLDAPTPFVLFLWTMLLRSVISQPQTTLCSSTVAPLYSVSR